MSALVRRSSTFWQLLLTLVLLAAAAGVLFFRQELIDEYTVRSFRPSSEIVAVGERASLSEKGEYLYLASRPELLARDPFNSACRSVATEKTAVLGCYVGNQIFLFDIDDQQLDGIKEVTAAHEMLHAAYQRLSTGEKERVDALLEKQAESLGGDSGRIGELMAEYARTEPGERLNELHSILGSEVATLDPELESYYSQYFKDRGSLVALADKYQAVFEGLKAKQDSLVAELNNLADSIDRDVEAYKRNSEVLSSDIRNFNARARSGSMSEAVYNSERASLEARQSALESDYNAIQAAIDNYEKKRTELSAINTESDALNRSINSSLTPVPEGL